MYEADIIQGLVQRGTDTAWAETAGGIGTCCTPSVTYLRWQDFDRAINNSRRPT